MLREITIFAQKADVTIDALGQASDQLNSMLTTLNNSHFGEKLAVIGDKSITCLDNIDTLTAMVTETAKGQGTLGRLMKDPSLYDTLLQCSSRTNQMISDINTYGVLFHTNRDWQREMHLRADEIAALSSSSVPESVRERFVKISQLMSELHLSLADAGKTLNRGSVSEDRALRDELSKGLCTVQQQLTNLSEVLRGTFPDTASDVADEESVK